MQIPTPYLLFVGDSVHAKTARGIRDWRPELCLAQRRYSGSPLDFGLPEMDFEEAYQAGARTVLLGAAPPGGVLPGSWVPDLVRALRAGMDIASGLHSRINDIPDLATAALEEGRMLWDVRHPRGPFVIGQFERRSGKRLLTVGTDCVVGKKYTALAIEGEMRRRGMDADFRATGQTGILISGSGIAIDAVVADFISAAAATLSPSAHSDHWDVIEGQGALFHPAYAGVTMGLIHGSQPDAMVLCADLERTRISEFELYPRPSLQDCIRRYTEAAQLTNPEAAVIGVSLNTSRMSPEAAIQLCEDTSAQLKLPCVDPIRMGVGLIVDNLGLPVGSHAAS